ncbi:MAG: glycosyltransferase family 39 protein [Bacteroidales bacterium]|nr:glycosyltransferase family 39 protein [Bacteroidales bacterium]
METQKGIIQPWGYRKFTLFLILGATLVRGFLAATTDLGNDEVYYILYAMFPDLSHFDHPPMVGFTIQLFSLDLFFRSEFFIRLGAIIFSALSTWVIYLTGETIKNARTGFFAALLFTASVYASIIAGTFILPDAPQMLFWLLALLSFYRAFATEETNKYRAPMVLAGIFTGLAMLSKYTAIFLWVGAALYVLLYQRQWLKKPVFYLSVLISMGLFSPVLVWNQQNDFISFSFQGSRALFSEFRPSFFLTELLGEFLYTNPIVYIMVAITLLQLVKGRKICEQKAVRFLLMMSLPMIGFIGLISFSRQTLPHWTGPAFFALLLLTACRLDSQWQNSGAHRAHLPAGIKSALILFLVGMSVSWIQVTTGIIPLEKMSIPDPTLDLYGWDQRGTAFREVRARAISAGNIKANAPIMERRWFPAAHYDYYLAHDAGIHVLGVNSPGQIHKYAWINHQRGGFPLHMDAWAIESTRDPQHPVKHYGKYFTQFTCYDTAYINRRGEVVDTLYFYIFRNLQIVPQLGQTVDKKR